MVSIPRQPSGQSDPRTNKYKYFSNSGVFRSCISVENAKYKHQCFLVVLRRSTNCLLGGWVQQDHDVGGTLKTRSTADRPEMLCSAEEGVCKLLSAEGKWHDLGGCGPRPARRRSADINQPPAWNSPPWRQHLPRWLSRSKSLALPTAELILALPVGYLSLATVYMNCPFLATLSLPFYQFENSSTQLITGKLSHLDLSAFFTTKVRLKTTKPKPDSTIVKFSIFFSSHFGPPKICHQY